MINKRLWIVFLLGFSSGLPLSLVGSTLQAWFSDVGVSVLGTGMLSLLGLPYAYRIFWGPFLDRYSLTSLGKRRSWMLMSQILLLLGFNFLAWFSPSSHPKIIAAIAVMLACVSATQDMAVEAHRTEYLLNREQGVGASVAVFGYRIALLISGGLALILAQHVGWSVTYRVMGFIMLIGVLASYSSEEPSLKDTAQMTLSGSFVEPLKELMSRKGIFSLFMFILFYKLGEAFTATTSGIVMPFLISGIGFPLETIGYVNKVGGVGAVILGGLAAGFVMMRWSMLSALFFFGLLQAITNVLFVALAISGKNIPLFAIAVIFDNFAAGMGTTAIVALFMRVVDKRFTATQFSLLAAIGTLPRIFSGPFAAILQSWFGWVGLYQISVILALGFIPFLYKCRHLISREPEMHQDDTEHVAYGTPLKR